MKPDVLWETAPVAKMAVFIIEHAIIIPLLYLCVVVILESDRGMATFAAFWLVLLNVMNMIISMGKVAEKWLLNIIAKVYLYLKAGTINQSE